MKNWQEFEDEIIRIVDTMDEITVPMKAYAQTYARSIVENLNVGRSYGVSDEEATRTQMLYVLSNLDGAEEGDLRRIERLAAERGIDISDAVKETLENR
jgi:protein tyrosine phosphatase (PTP) superfamily phosphohydrolase (DUF442 family)